MHTTRHIIKIRLRRHGTVPLLHRQRQQLTVQLRFRVSAASTAPTDMVRIVLKLIASIAVTVTRTEMKLATDQCLRTHIALVEEAV